MSAKQCISGSASRWHHLREGADTDWRAAAKRELFDHLVGQHLH